MYYLLRLLWLKIFAVPFSIDQAVCGYLHVCYFHVSKFYLHDLSFVIHRPTHQSTVMSFGVRLHHNEGWIPQKERLLYSTGDWGKYKSRIGRFSEKCLVVGHFMSPNKTWSICFLPGFPPVWFSVWFSACLVGSTLLQLSILLGDTYSSEHFRLWILWKVLCHLCNAFTTFKTLVSSFLHTNN